ncbi:PIG-L deacetylase family protein [Gulosibacter bifidus]|uniref:PIG-L deacetylase family protein n=1 Tax=Gulosibacter bifidus TaxID=272239 RepID=A0ABW5RGR7_9MICO|nr:hypothetical protein [Gulosibacter bifidus]
MSTVLALHASTIGIPLLTGGTLARLAEAGQRVVIVTLTGDPAAEIGEHLGAARVESLGYAFSPGGACNVPESALDELETLLADETDISLVLGYDKGGFDLEPTHALAHRIATEFAASRGAALVNAAIPREMLSKAHTLAKMLGRSTPIDNEVLDSLPTKSTVDYRINPLTHVPKKWDAVAELSRGTDRLSQILAKVMQLPRIMIAPMFKTEYFVNAPESPAPVPEYFTAL